MNPSRQRAWLALEIGPLWHLRRRAAPSAAHAMPDASVLRTAAPLSAGDLFLLPDAGARWLFIGPADSRQHPQAEADSLHLLAQMMAAIGLRPGELSHVAIQRPPAQRIPAMDFAGRPADAVSGAAAFLPQIDALAPRVIVALGEDTARLLLRAEVPFAGLRTRPHSWRGLRSAVPVVVTWHPRALLELPQRKAQAWHDLCRARDIVDRPDVSRPGAGRPDVDPPGATAPDGGGATK